MSKPMKTPGVYIKELDAFGNAVIPVPTAVPAFIGYTEQTTFKGTNLLNTPIKVDSLAMFKSIFEPSDESLRPPITFNVEKANHPSETSDLSSEGEDYVIRPSSKIYRLHSAIRFFYANGGGECYIVSIGDLKTEMKIYDFTAALKLLEQLQEPTMLVIPDAVELTTRKNTDALEERFSQVYALQTAMINHCGTMMNRVAILDVPGGYNEPFDQATGSVDVFRNQVNPESPTYNSYAAAYYPWLHTSVYEPTEITYKNIDESSYPTVHKILTAEIIGLGTFFDIDKKTLAPGIARTLSIFSSKPDTKSLPIISDYMVDATLNRISTIYPLILKKIRNQLNLMPPSAAIAGIYTAVDANDGVWQAPANVAVQSIVAPAVKIDSTMQEELNVPIDGKSVCAIRSFVGRGILVWGARTLDGNSNDWRYINVRRTLIFIEQSVKDAAKVYVFASNDASTWVNVQSMISNFLTGMWKQGGLVGPKPADAFSVSVGLGTTMTNEDIRLGIMRVSVKVAVSHPAEFIEITFQQEMQKA